ncbi:MAG: hypothetical protein RMX96_33915 [Nostoc sp. ChiSLP02]|nr:hypothetical protein [Nostoc sp. DedSLP05]MDZ8097169.1 hypothetical protein [Nostoc sp. DedSLP01]MDZ8189818.1 hypothetical protein [Nostoc sp. ChiSLP02]
MMKRLILSTLSLVLISTATAPVFASEKIAIGSTDIANNSLSTTGIEPFNLVGLAYQGYFEQQGIPGYNNLIVGYQTKEITAKDIVRSAVKTNRLPSEVLNDKGYINAVKNTLDGFGRNVVP